MSKRLDYKKLAKDLICCGYEIDLAVRYLDVRRRQTKLHRAYKQFLSLAIEDHPLRKIAFRGPLCVAGQPSAVVVRAEGLNLIGVPVATELDARGMHRGVPIETVISRLLEAEDKPYTAIEVLALYSTFASATNLAEGLANPRAVKARRMLNRLDILRPYLEGKLRKAAIEFKRESKQ